MFGQQSIGPPFPTTRRAGQCSLLGNKRSRGKFQAWREPSGWSALGTAWLHLAPPAPPCRKFGGAPRRNARQDGAFELITPHLGVWVVGRPEMDQERGKPLLYFYMISHQLRLDTITRGEGIDWPHPSPLLHLCGWRCCATSAATWLSAGLWIGVLAATCLGEEGEGVVRPSP